MKRTYCFIGKWKAPIWFSFFFFFSEKSTYLILIPLYFGSHLAFFFFFFWHEVDHCSSLAVKILSEIVKNLVPSVNHVMKWQCEWPTLMRWFILFKYFNFIGQWMIYVYKLIFYHHKIFVHKRFVWFFIKLSIW